MQNQAYIFAIFILNGFIIGILFDIFRILRKSFKTLDFITYIEDILFWILSGLILLYSIFKFSNGELRLFIFIGVIIGALLYMLIFSKIFIRISVYSITIIKRIFKVLVFIPIKFIYKMLKKVIMFVLGIIKKSIKNFTLKIQKMFFRNRKLEKKKDFV